ncbi:cache domain-containing protein [Arcobacter sp. CECT 8985]|uniref:cache domain-containing protein n=1 Tax=Arcobacter sp. CECT 8985 TaxID=1935424 RepID=UPI00100B7D3F|nr:cache domain-containing protein [Arcobacter sp. CECT 8985]RXJ87379.1 hypothetical protein CRU93_04585 [Arcobacter sp. CECT 8985]
MSKTSKYLFIIGGITSFFICVIFYLLTILNNTDELINKLDDSLTMTKNLFEEQKRYALSLSILLSQDKELISSYIKKDRMQSFKIVNKKIKILNSYQNSKFEVQIHNKDLTTYLRSWDFNIKNVPLANFRKGLVKVKKTKKPLVSIELGKRLNIKAISPILENNKFIGSIETIINFKYLSKYLQNKGYKLFILLNSKYLNIATKMKNSDKIGNFALINEANIDDLKGVDLKDLFDYGYTSSKNYSFSYFSFYNLNNQRLGYIFTAIQNKGQYQLKNAFKDIENNLKKIQR